MRSGIALGLLNENVAIMRASDETHGHVNRHLNTHLRKGLAAPGAEV